MAQEQQSRRRKPVLWAAGIVVALAFAVVVICGYLFGWKWTGLVAAAHYPNRTLWDWLDLLIVPVVLAIGGYLFTRSESRATRAVAERRTEDEALQAYLDQMGQLLLDKAQPLRQSEEESEERTFARARTLTVLPRLDGVRKGSVLQFLSEAGLIAQDSPVIALGGADLSGANLSGANLSGIWLREADLSRAHLVGTLLPHADLSRANLSGADLRRANLTGAALKRTDLTGTDVRGARLTWTNLRFALLSDADLSNAQLITNEELAQQTKHLKGATMPNGQKYEDWLKDREGRGEDGENDSPS